MGDPWFREERSAGRAQVETPVDGGYLNDEHVHAGHLDLDAYGEIHREIVAEMHEIMEWWTQQRLVHSATFGVRIYHHGSVLLTHVDHGRTHLASAVLQVDQATEGDEGWPLEVLTDDSECHEVYLQPGQMVLYEGARFRHGRPMLFEGQYMANIFSHFRPASMRG